MSSPTDPLADAVARLEHWLRGSVMSHYGGARPEDLVAIRLVLDALAEAQRLEAERDRRRRGLQGRMSSGNRGGGPRAVRGRAGGQAMSDPTALDRLLTEADAVAEHVGARSASLIGRLVAIVRVQAGVLDVAAHHEITGDGKTLARWIAHLQRESAAAIAEAERLAKPEAVKEGD